MIDELLVSDGDVFMNTMELIHRVSMGMMTQDLIWQAILRSLDSVPWSVSHGFTITFKPCSHDLLSFSLHALHITSNAWRESAGIEISVSVNSSRSEEQWRQGGADLGFLLGLAISSLKVSI
jgi:hypothetical protein